MRQEALPVRISPRSRAGAIFAGVALSGAALATLYAHRAEHRKVEVREVPLSLRRLGAAAARLVRRALELGRLAPIGLPAAVRLADLPAVRRLADRALEAARSRGPPAAALASAHVGTPRASTGVLRAVAASGRSPKSRPSKRVLMIVPNPTSRR